MPLPGRSIHATCLFAWYAAFENDRRRRQQRYTRLYSVFCLPFLQSLANAFFVVVALCGINVTITSLCIRGVSWKA